MRSRFWFQLLCLSIIVSLIYCVVGLASYQRITKPAREEGRKNLYLLLANILESSDYTDALKMFEKFRVESPSLASNIWVLSSDGKILASNTPSPLPEQWQEIPKPDQPHQLSGAGGPLQMFHEMTLIRLNAQSPTYALIKPTANRPIKRLALFQIILFSTGIFITAISGLCVAFLYLRRTSIEAKDVISGLHSGNLKARFKISKWGQINDLKLDFNGMAEQIELLVNRVKKTEATRKNLLQELGHDLRTPLTSMKAAVETLDLYRGKMSPEQQTDFILVLQSELNYFIDLLDDLFFISEIAEPSYESGQKKININVLVNEEVQSRVIAYPQLTWRLCSLEGDVILAVDPLLFRRLLRNTFDNAVKYASNEVHVRLRVQGERVEIEVEDDGPGMSVEAIESFGVRKRHRIPRKDCVMDMSLGLGSVIIGAIVNLHGATLRIQSGKNDKTMRSGTRFIYSFPKYLR